MVIALRKLRKTKVTKWMSFATVPYFETNYGNLSKWRNKNWTHGDGTNKGKPIAHVELWKEIDEILELIEVDFVFNPKGASHQSVYKSAQEMALLPKNT